MKHLKPEEIITNPFVEFKNNPALVTARKDQRYNMCTIGWGTIGVLFSENVLIVYVKPKRFTDRFLQNDDYFTVTFLNENHKKDIALCGTKSGRKIDKCNIPTLKPIYLDNGITFEGFTRTYVLKKIYQGKLKKANFVDSDYIIDRYYKSERPHNVYIGKIIDIIEQ